MHGKFGGPVEADSEMLFFAGLPDSEPPADKPRSAYGAARSTNWPAILTIAAAHVALLVGLVQFDVIEIKKKPQPMVVIDIAEAAPPPPADQPKPETKPELVVPPIVSPPPIVTTEVITPPPLAVAPPPPKPAPIAAPPAPTAMAVENLDEKMVDGKPPIYPTESRRKKEQGTVVLRLLIGTNGRVEQVSIAQSSGFDRLDQAALLAARTWRWQPMLREGHAVEVRGTMSIPFALRA